MLAGLATAAPAIVASLDPVLVRRRRKSLWRPVGRVDDFPHNEVRAAKVEYGRADWNRWVEETGGYVWRRELPARTNHPAGRRGESGDPQRDGEFVVFARNCTDLSCPVTYDAGSRCFFCPCHGGIFAQDGAPMAGPPPRPLFRYAVRLQDGTLEIDPTPPR